MRKCILLLLMVCLLSGCGKKNGDGITDRFPSQDLPAGDSWLTQPEGPTATIAPLESDKTALEDSIRLELLQNQLPTASDYLIDILDALNIQVTDISRDGNVITATVKITAPDMVQVARQLEGLFFETREEADSAICSLIPQVSGRTATVTVTFRKGDDRWIPDMSEELIDACYGGLLTYSQDHSEVG